MCALEPGSQALKRVIGIFGNSTSVSPGSDLCVFRTEREAYRWKGLVGFNAATTSDSGKVCLRAVSAAEIFSVKRVVCGGVQQRQ